MYRGASGGYGQFPGKRVWMAYSFTRIYRRFTGCSAIEGKRENYSVENKFIHDL